MHRFDFRPEEDLGRLRKPLAHVGRHANAELSPQVCSWFCRGDSSQKDGQALPTREAVLPSYTAGWEAGVV